MLAIQKLVRNGSSTQVTIPRTFLNVLEWLPGQLVAVEYCADKTVRVRKPRERDFQRTYATGKILFDPSLPKP